MTTISSARVNQERIDALAALAGGLEAGASRFASMFGKKRVKNPWNILAGNARDARRTPQAFPFSPAGTLTRRPPPARRIRSEALLTNVRPYRSSRPVRPSGPSCPRRHRRPTGRRLPSGRRTYRGLSAGIRKETFGKGRGPRRTCRRTPRRRLRDRRPREGGVTRRPAPGPRRGT